MPLPINLPPVPAIPKEGISGSGWMRWLTILQSSVARLGSLWAYSKTVQVTGFAYQIPVGQGLCLFTPAGALASGTVTLASGSADGFQQHILSSQTVSALTVAPGSGQTIVGSASGTLSAGTEWVFVFTAAANVWYRMR